MTALTRLRLTNYRNYEALDLKLDGRHVCLFGANGAGKTNLLEAVSQLGPGRSLRNAPLPDIARQDGPAQWTVSAELDNGQRLGVGLEPGSGASKRTIRLDGAPAAAGDLADLMRIVWLVPAMDSVFRAGASERRRFFDRQVMAHRPAHGRAAAAYEKAMRDRNALLEQGRIDPAWADAIEARMAEHGAEIMINRAEVLDRLQSGVDGRPEGHFPKADLSLEGDETMVAPPDAMPGDLADKLATALSEGRWRDKGAGRTLSGPHRADLAVVHRPTGAPAGQASTGQQKALLIGLILASARSLSERADGPMPLVLLDEAAAHLDADRRAALFDELSDLGGQAWLTGTEAFLFEAFEDRAVKVEVSEGTAQIAA
ncbi:MAG: DNA replication/repair protein RecF [Pseudomonadota bacterium]